MSLIQTPTFIILLAITLLAALVALWVVVRCRKLAHQISQLNAEIESQKIALSEARKESNSINESNLQRLTIIADTLRMTSKLINDNDSYRKKLLRQFKVNHLDELGAMLSSQEATKDQYQQFHDYFDSMVTTLFPDIADEDISKRQDSDADVKSRTLNTRTRILALKRLGLTKSSEIAEMLNLSIRTIYNNKPTDPCS